DAAQDSRTIMAHDLDLDERASTGRRDGGDGRSLEVDGVRVIIHTEGTTVASIAAPGAGSLVHVEIVGHDRPGILRSVSGVFAAHGLNVEELASERVSAPMGGGTLFQAHATVLIPPNVKVSAVRADLEKI